MRLNKSAPNIDALFEALHQLPHAADPSTTANQSETFEFSKQIGQGSVQRWRLRPGIDLMINDLAFHQKTVIERESPDHTTQLGISFCVAGQMQGLNPKAGQAVQFKAGQASLGVINNTKMSIEYAAKQRVLLVHMHVQPDAINLAAEGATEQWPTPLQNALAGRCQSAYFQTCTMTAVMGTTVRQLLHCPYQGLTQRLYLESKTIELIGLYFDQLLSSHRSPHDASGLRPDEIDRIFYAREILLAELASPPTLLTLSRQVGLNDRKLKQGFRQVFGTTVFGYLRDYRMQQAQQLLLMPGTTIAGVAQVVGYRNPEAFSVAFRRTFAISPKAYQLQQR